MTFGNAIIHYRYESTAGEFLIAQTHDKRWHLLYADESYGGYEHPWQAADDLANNATFSINHASTGEPLDTSTLMIPGDLADWQKVSDNACN